MENRKGTGRRWQIFWILAVSVVSLAVTAALIVFESKTEMETPVKQARLVRTLQAEQTAEQVVVEAFGTVQADRELTLKAEVSGRVVYQAANLAIGGIVNQGEALVRLDPRDFQNLVQQARAAVELARFELQVERGRQVVAKREWEQLKDSIRATDLSEELALRKPHLREKQAALSAAISRYDKAKLDLKRTVVASPMKAIVISEAVEIGDYVTPQSEIARLAAVDQFRVQVSLPVDKLRWIKLPKAGEEGSVPVRVIQETGARQIVRKGRLMRLLGDLEPGGRMARLLVAVEDPLGLNDGDMAAFPLLIGSYIKVEIDGPKIEGLFVLPRAAVRENDQVWIMNREGRLEVREIGILQKREQTVLVDRGIAEGDRIILSALPLPVPGMELRTEEEER